MSQPLVLSLFPGIGLLDMAFEEEGFCVVRGPDVLWGGDIRRFHPPSGMRFDGVIGGPPCPFASSAANVARAAGKSVAPDLIPEFARVVLEVSREVSAGAGSGRNWKPPTLGKTHPWWVMENVPGSHSPHGLPGIMACQSVKRLENRWFGAEQHRERLIFSNILGLDWNHNWDYALFENPSRAPTAATSVWKDGRQYGDHTERRFREVVRLQGLPDDFDLPGFTVRKKLHAVVNGVPLSMGRAIARAVKRAMRYTENVA